MGRYYYAISVIGLRVPKEEIIDLNIESLSEPENHCRCTPKIDPSLYPSAKYCPNCGAFIRYQYHINSFKRPEYSTMDWREHDDLHLLGWPVRTKSGGFTFTDARDYFIGIQASPDVSGIHKAPLPQITEETMTKFKNDMESLGLWDEDRFGWWTISWCSC